MKRAIILLIAISTVILLSVLPTSADTVPANYAAEPVIMSFEGAEGMLKTGCYLSDQNGVEGEYRFVNINGQDCIELLYAPGTGYADYRMMPKFMKSGKLSSEHKYVRITYMAEDIISAKLTMINNKGGSAYVLCDDTSVSKGEWVISNTVVIDEQMIQRLNEPKHCTIGYTSENQSAGVYIKELAFFTSAEQAQAYYGDDAWTNSFTYGTMSFGANINAELPYTLLGEYYGNAVLDEESGTVRIEYAEKTNHGVNYMAKLKFNSPKLIENDQIYVRVYYSADHTDDASPAVMRFQNDGIAGSVSTLSESILDTSGKYVLTDPAPVNQDIIDRFSGTGTRTSHSHISLHIVNTSPDCVYNIKAIYFFDSLEAAAIFVPPEEARCRITVNGSNISEYRIVIAEDGGYYTEASAKRLAGQIACISGVNIPTVTDAFPVSQKEILLGQSKRPLSRSGLDMFSDGDDYSKRFCASVCGDTLIITANSHYALKGAVDGIVGGYLFENRYPIPEEIAITDKFVYSGMSSLLTKSYIDWTEPEVRDEPFVYTEDFSSDTRIFTEENGQDDWTVGQGVLSVEADEFSYSYIHVYESNASLSGEFTAKNAKDTGKTGVMLRVTAPEAYVSGGYDFGEGCFYIAYREGADFYEMRCASLEATLHEGNVYNIELTVNGKNAELSLNGEAILTADSIFHVTPGRAAVYAEDTALIVDNVSLTLLSDEGTVLRGVEHTVIPYDKYLEGGSVVEMTDGTLYYTHGSGVNYRSLDGGRNWTECEAFSSYVGRPQFLRLITGELFKIDKYGSAYYSFISNDEGASWTRGGKLCDTAFSQNSEIGGGNMNDKVTQSAKNGRIFYSVNYECPSGVTFDGRAVFCQYFYSDDKGASWTASDTGSWEIEGNEDAYKFGECKLLECADGTIRMYCSWQDNGCIVYADSNDGGKTFGALEMLSDLHCSRSSMQFFRDPYGETDTTYYMVWVNSYDNPINGNMPRAALTLAKSTDGKEWTVLGDIWRWESNYAQSGALLNHIVDPFIMCTRDKVIVGTGLSEYMSRDGDNSFHGAQRQHIWSIDKETLGAALPEAIIYGDANGDGSANAIDLAYFQRYLAGWTGYDESKVDLSVLDLDLNGKTNAIDAAVLARHIARWIGYESLPYFK